MNRILKITATVALALLSAAPAAPAQNEGAEMDPAQMAELIRQIRRNMMEVERSLDRVETEAGKAAAEEARKNIDKLIDDMKGRGQQITSDIDEIVRNLKKNGGGGGGGGQQSQSPSNSQSPQNRGQARNRNQPENQGQDQQQPSEKQGGQQEDNSQRNPASAQNRPSGPRDPDERVKVDHEQIVEKWGNLPPELRRLLIERNFNQFMPEYQEELKAYYKKIANLK